MLSQRWCDRKVIWGEGCFWLRTSISLCPSLNFYFSLARPFLGLCHSAFDFSFFSALPSLILKLPQWFTLRSFMPVKTFAATLYDNVQFSCSHAGKPGDKRPEWVPPLWSELIDHSLSPSLPLSSMDMALEQPYPLPFAHIWAFLLFPYLSVIILYDTGFIQYFHLPVFLMLNKT